MPVNRVFRWDPKKAESNIKKHGLSFERASEIFEDPNCISRIDRIQNGEQRWQTIGVVDGIYVVLVAHTLFASDEEDNYVEYIRIISARKADKKERTAYDNGHF